MVGRSAREKSSNYLLPPELLLHQNSSSGSVVSSIIIGAFISKLSFSFISVSKIRQVAQEAAFEAVMEAAWE